MFTFFEWCLDREYIEKNPVVRTKNVKEETKSFLPFSNVQARLLSDYLQLNEPQLYLFTRFMFYTFLRPNEEIRFLRVGDIRDGKVFMPSERAKGNLDKFVRCPGQLLNLVKEYGILDYPPDFYVFGNTGVPGTKHYGEVFFARKHRAVMAKLGISDDRLKMYSWKHTGNVALFMSGCNLKLIQEQNRHSSLSQTEIYLKGLGLFLKDDKLIFAETF